jgi:hypothetical protein
MLMAVAIKARYDFPIETAGPAQSNSGNPRLALLVRNRKPGIVRNPLCAPNGLTGTAGSTKWHLRSRVSLSIVYIWPMPISNSEKIGQGPLFAGALSPRPWHPAL